VAFTSFSPKSYENFKTMLLIQLRRADYPFAPIFELASRPEP
jgi:hypothetical protein